MSDNVRKPNILTFTPNQFYEDLIITRRDKPQVFEKMSMATHAALAMYEKAKQKAEQDGEAA